MKFALKILFMLLVLGCTKKIIYIEILEEEPVEEEPVEVVVPLVRVNVINSSTTYSDGTPFVSANGLVMNSGPGSVTSVRVLLTSNHGYVRSVSSRPSGLREEEYGTWKVSGLQGTYIKYKDTQFSYDH